MRFTSQRPRDLDIVAVKSQDDTFFTFEFAEGKLRALEGPFNRATAEETARSAAEDSGTDAWVQEAPNDFRLLRKPTK